MSDHRKFPQLHEIARSSAVGGGGRRCLTREQNDAQDELRADLGDVVNLGAGIILPFYETRANDPLSATGTTSTTGDQGGMTIGTDVPEIGAALRAGLVLEGLGASVFGGLKSNCDFPSMPTAISCAWASENAAAADAGEAFSQLALTPLRVTAYLNVSSQLLKQQGAIEPYLRRELMSALGAACQQVAIAGTGADGQPVGIINTVGIGSVAGGTNGLAPTNAHLCSLEHLVTGTAKADRGKCAWITSPYVRRKLRQTFINGTGSDPIWDQADAYSLFGHPAGVTPSCPDTLTKGSASGVCSAIIFGSMDCLILGFWGSGVSVEAVSSVALNATGQVRLVATTYFNCGVRSPAAFAAMLDCLAA